MAVAWALDAIVDRAPGPEDLVAHRLAPLAARSYRRRGLPVPALLLEYERAAVAAAVTVPVLLARIRAAAEGPLVLVKGPELAARYPGDALRLFGDLDLLAPDPPAVRRALLAAGFEEAPRASKHETSYHLHPLQWPGLALQVEVHRRPNWPRRLPVPPAATFFERLVPSATGVAGVETLPSERHVLLVAAHAWAHAPLTTLRDLVDLAALLEDCDRDDVQTLADAWGLGRMWRTTVRAVDSVVLATRSAGPAQRVWARHLAGTRERTVFESHLEDWLSTFSLLPPAAAALATARELASEALPAAGESWDAKLRRSRLALRHAFLRKSLHDRKVRSEEAG
jgi:hypothetical protein